MSASPDLHRQWLEKRLQQELTKHRCCPTRNHIIITRRRKQKERGRRSSEGESLTGSSSSSLLHCIVFIMTAVSWNVYTDISQCVSKCPCGSGPDRTCHKALSQSRLHARTSDSPTHPPEPLGRLHPGGLPAEAQRRPHGVIEHHLDGWQWSGRHRVEPAATGPDQQQLLPSEPASAITTHYCFFSFVFFHSGLFNRQWPRPQASNHFPTMARKHKHGGGGGGSGPGLPASLAPH